MRDGPWSWPTQSGVWCQHNHQVRWVGMRWTDADLDADGRALLERLTRALGWVMRWDLPMEQPLADPMLWLVWSDIPSEEAWSYHTWYTRGDDRWCLAHPVRHYLNVPSDKAALWSALKPLV